MRYLTHRKIAIADKLGSRALRADAMKAVTCGWHSFVVVSLPPEATFAQRWRRRLAKTSTFSGH